MFGRKEKLTFQVFMKQHYLPLILRMVDSEINRIQTQIEKNSPAILISKDQIRFELFLMFLRAAEFNLLQTKGYNERFFDCQILIVDEFLNTTFPHIEMNPKVLTEIGDRLFSDQWYYYRNKWINGFRKYEKFQKERFAPSIISGIFFAHFCEFGQVNNQLSVSIEVLYKETYIKFASYIQNYQIVPDKQ